MSILFIACLFPHALNRKERRGLKHPASGSHRGATRTRMAEQKPQRCDTTGVSVVGALV
jgi:hypothetical protein